MSDDGDGEVLVPSRGFGSDDMTGDFSYVPFAEIASSRPLAGFWV